MAGRRRHAPRSPAARAPGRERLEGDHVVREALRARRRKLHRLLVPRDAGGHAAELLEEARRAGVPVEERPPEAARSRDPGEGGAPSVLLEAGPLPQSSLEEMLARDGSDRRVVLLDGVEDPHNLGAIARVAEGAGAIGLVTTHRRAAPLSPAASRASAGALEWLPVARVPNLRRAMESLKQAGFWLVGADPGAPDTIFELEPRLLRGDLGVVLGAEGRGMRQSVASALDFRVRIPMSGQVGSLNVSTAAAVILYELARRAAPRPEVTAKSGESR